MSEMDDFNRGVIDEFRANHGKLGGPFDGASMVLLTTTGAKSGKQRVNPLATLPEKGTLYVFASKGGAPTDPDWYRNLVAHPDVEVEYGDEKFAAVAHVLTGAERDRVWAAQKGRVPAFADYEKGTSRVIPVVELRRNN
ncbi:MAG TPA: nitroreductase family deazaflavin-dependent oxidoreductase [Acidimicrobiales bacterium]